MSLNTLNPSSIAKSVLSHLEAMRNDQKSSHSSSISFGSNSLSVETVRNDDATGLHRISVNSINKVVELPFDFLDFLIQAFHNKGEQWGETVAHIAGLSLKEPDNQVLSFLDTAIRNLAKLSPEEIADQTAAPAVATGDGGSGEVSIIGCS